MSTGARRASMTLFSDGSCHYSHRVRLVLAEKGITAEVIDVDPAQPVPEVIELNPYGTLPLLLDRDLVLYENKVMMEYLDERFPHPPLLPAYPVTRSEARQLIYRIERNWCGLVDTLLANDTSKAAEAARNQLREGLAAVAPVFAEKPYFMSDEFTLVDACMAPILWRLPRLGIDFEGQAEQQPLLDYADRLFSRPAFRASLSRQEAELRPSRAA